LQQLNYGEIAETLVLIYGPYATVVAVTQANISRKAGEVKMEKCWQHVVEHMNFTFALEGSHAA
jgi:hypothetical protein